MAKCIHLSHHCAQNFYLACQTFEFHSLIFIDINMLLHAKINEESLAGKHVWKSPLETIFYSKKITFIVFRKYLERRGTHSDEITCGILTILLLF